MEVINTIKRKRERDYSALFTSTDYENGILSVVRTSEIGNLICY